MPESATGGATTAAEAAKELREWLNGRSAVDQLGRDLRLVLDDYDHVRARLADIGETGTQWGARIGASVRGVDCVSDAYDMARAYGGSVRTRQLYAGPWREVDDSAGEEGSGDE